MKSKKALLTLGLLMASGASLAGAQTQTPDQRDRAAYPDTRHDEGNNFGWIGLLGLAGLAGLLGRRAASDYSRRAASDYDVHGQVRRAP
jgi:MYXO-CTERM domain-containing protein